MKQNNITPVIHKKQGASKNLFEDLGLAELRIGGNTRNQ